MKGIVGELVKLVEGTSHTQEDSQSSTGSTVHSKQSECQPSGVSPDCGREIWTGSEKNKTRRSSENSL